MKRIQAKKHKIGTYEIDKISLSCFDDKRYVLDDGIHTLAYFHKDSNDWKILWWLKNIVIIGRDYNNEKILWWWKNIVMVGRYYDNEKML